MNIPFKYGFPLSRWKKTLHCMIQKRPLPYLNKLRIVQLYAADFNSVLKFVLSKNMMRHNGEHGNTSKQLYAQKTKATYDALITSRAIYDLARIRRDNIVSIFNDIKGNYDRVRPALNTITTRRMGLPKGHTVSHARVLRGMKHQIRTGFGISEESIEWDPTQNIGGLGQGNGSGPPSWHSHCLPLESSYKSMTDNKIEFTTASGLLKLKQWLVGYVDDNTLLAQIKKNNLDHMQPRN